MHDDIVHILVVDALADSAHTIAALLRLNGYDVPVETSDRDVLALVARTRGSETRSFRSPLAVRRL